MRWLALKSLRYPFLVAGACLFIGLAGGLMMEFGGLEGFFGRAGAITVALGVATFGATAAELLIKAQSGLITAPDGQLPFPCNRKNLENVMGMQALVVVVGTLQWGFGDLMVEV